MELVSSTGLLQEARKSGYAITAFNIHTLEMLQSVVEAADEARSPLIIQTTTGTVKHLGADYITAAAKIAAKNSRVPIALHLDHCQDFDLIMICMKAGYTSVMIDASMHPFEENIKRTKEVMKIANILGVNVEAELGKVGGVEDNIVVSEADALLADPDECVAFVQETRVSTLAPAIGTAHGIYKGDPKIDFARIQEISEKVQVPLVLHGGSGIPTEQVKKCVSLGMAKMNVATELKNAFSNSIRDSLLDESASLDPRSYMTDAKAAVKKLALFKMEICGCINRV